MMNECEAEFTQQEMHAALLRNNEDRAKPAMHYRLVPEAEKGLLAVTFRNVEFDWPEQGNWLDIRAQCIDKWCRLPEFCKLKENKAFVAELGILARHVRLADLDYGAYALLNHWLLDEPARRHREALIENELCKFFDPRLRHRLEPDDQEKLACCQPLMKLTPTSDLSRMTYLMAWWMKDFMRDDCVRRIVAAREHDLPEQEALAIDLLVEHFPMFPCINVDIFDALQELHGQAAVAELLPAFHFVGCMLMDDGMRFRDAVIQIVQSPRGLGFFFGNCSSAPISKPRTSATHEGTGSSAA